MQETGGHCKSDYSVFILYSLSFLPNKIVGDWQAAYTPVVEKCFSQQNSMPVCFNYYLFKCLMSVLPKGKAREQNHWKRLNKIGGKKALAG